MSAFTRRRLYLGESVACGWCGLVHTGTADRRPLMAVDANGVLFCNDEHADRYAIEERAMEDAQGEYEAGMAEGGLDG